VEIMSAFKERRRAARELAGQHGMYLLSRTRELGWHDCHLVDASELGAGARLRGPKPECGDDLTFCLDGPDGNASVLVPATVRHVRSDFFGATRVGVEFKTLDGPTRDALVRLLRAEPVSALPRRTESPSQSKAV
jgi:hypothetical protein